MHISYTFKETWKIFTASSNPNYSTKYNLRHWKTKFKTALEQMCFYLHIDYHVYTQLSMSVVWHSVTKSRTRLHLYFAQGLLQTPRGQCDCIKPAGEAHSRICSHIIQPSTFHTAIHFLPMHLGFFPVRECQERQGGMVHTWILFRPATSTQLDLEGTPGLHIFKGIWNP